MFGPSWSDRVPQHFWWFPEPQRHATAVDVPVCTEAELAPALGFPADVFLVRANLTCVAPVSTSSSESEYDPDRAWRENSTRELTVTGTLSGTSELHELASEPVELDDKSVSGWTGEGEEGGALAGGVGNFSSIGHKTCARDGESSIARIVSVVCSSSSSTTVPPVTAARTLSSCRPMLAKSRNAAVGIICTPDGYTASRRVGLRPAFPAIHGKFVGDGGGLLPLPDTFPAPR